MEGFSSLPQVAAEVVKCRLCPRLVRYRENVPPRKSFASEKYWRKPVSGFGDPGARLMILGLAPAANGANRTGRVFTGDESARFLVRALYEAGYANQPTSESSDDGLAYTDCYVTAVVKCAPPQNRPIAKEFENCSVYLDSELRLLRNVRSVLALGGGAFGAYLGHVKKKGITTKGVRFAHGSRYTFEGLPTLYASYHPSPQNTYTGRLTKEMLLSVLVKIRDDLKTMVSARTAVSSPANEKQSEST